MINIGFGFTFQEALDAAEAKKVVLPEIYYGELQGAARSSAFSTAMLSSIDQLNQVNDSLLKALGDGLSFESWKKIAIADPTLHVLPKYKLETIYRTNIQGSFNSGKWARFEKTKVSRPYVMYDSINDGRTRETHRALNGVIKRLDDPFWDIHGPANGFNCRCRLISLNEKQMKSRGGVSNDSDIGGGDSIAPDKGWDYNAGKGLKEGHEEAWDNKPDNLIKGAASGRL